LERKYLTVSALNGYLKYQFDNDVQLQNILLKGEISNFTRHSRGHLYLTLKDDKSQISAVMFAMQTRNLLFLPKDGSKVIIEGYVSIYEPSGKYQIYINKMSEDGIGDLYMAYERLKANLESEGLFDQKWKRPIPLFPKAVGVITSPTGAAVRDVIQVISRRYPLTKIILYPALVQGEEAKNSVVKQIEKANLDHLVDVLIVGRGGGSIEDLWAFNEEIVARSIHSSKIPIISAVGHETDFTIADFVADLRAATPSQAAELAVPDQQALLKQIRTDINKMNQLLNKELSERKKQLFKIQNATILKNPSRLFETNEMKLEYLLNRLRRLSPEETLIKKQEEINTLASRLFTTYRQSLTTFENRYIRNLEKLELVNPLAIMKKGFSIVKKEEHLITSVNDVKLRDQINIEFVDGILTCEVNKIEKGEA